MAGWHSPLNINHQKVNSEKRFFLPQLSPPSPSLVLRLWKTYDSAVYCRLHCGIRKRQPGKVFSTILDNFFKFFFSSFLKQTWKKSKQFCNRKFVWYHFFCKKTQNPKLQRIMNKARIFFLWLFWTFPLVLFHWNISKKSKKIWVLWREKDIHLAFF